MLFIDNQTVQQILTIDDAINSQDIAFRGLVDGAAIHRPRIDMYVPTGRKRTTTAGARWRARAATSACSRFG